jgi:hypothetical protein
LPLSTGRDRGHSVAVIPDYNFTVSFDVVGIVGERQVDERHARPRSNFDHRHLDAIVSRLRRKLEEHTCLPAPIKAVYGVGYTFTATAAVQ